MKLRILFVLGWTACFAPAQVSTCQPVEGDRIVARDLAAALPEFGAAPAEALVAQAPQPGARRDFHASELGMLAHRFGIALATAEDICFAWAVHPLDRVGTIAAMQESLQVAAAQIEITEVTSDRVPEGRIEFPLSRLGTPSANGPSEPVLWRGDVLYGESHRFAIWARVKIAAPCHRLIAAANLKAGQAIEPRQIRDTAATCFPAPGRLPAAEQVTGMVLQRSVAAGTELRADMLTPPNDVNRGDEVQVEVRSGNTRLVLTARAVTAGRSGETISVRNPDSNRIFPARITGKGTAIVDAGNPRGI